MAVEISNFSWHLSPSAGCFVRKEVAIVEIMCYFAGAYNSRVCNMLAVLRRGIMARFIACFVRPSALLKALEMNGVYVHIYRYACL